MAGTITATTIQNDTSSPPTFRNISVEIGTLCRAWVNFNGTGTVAIRASFNVSSITDNGTGDYTVNFTNAMPDANYSYTAGGQGESSGSPAVDDCFFNINRLNTSVQAGSIRVGSRQAGAIIDAPYYCVAIFR